MEISNLHKAVLLLEDGTSFEGTGVGPKGTTIGEICFNTGMTGYQEVFTDPSYFGQVLVTTVAHIGNYGIKTEDQESAKIQISGLVCKNLSSEYSRAIADKDIHTYFAENNLICIFNVDTRALVKHVRDKGAMNCIISTDNIDIEVLKKTLTKAPSMQGLELASRVTTTSPYTVDVENPICHIGVLDFGTKQNIVNSLNNLGCKVTVFPAKTRIKELLNFHLDGFLLSNGPGDPASMPYAIETIQALFQTKKPIFGICLGHQLLALANGIATYKMHNGHRGANHPVKNLLTGHCEITSQNHGFGISEKALEQKSSEIEITHINLNDDTVECIKMRNYPAFSVQYHPESHPGPHDSKYLFDQFVDLVLKVKNN